MVGATLVEQVVDVAGALAPLAVLLGVWLGKRWESRTSTDAWLRDRRLAAYTRFIEHVGELHDGASAARRGKAGDDSSERIDQAYRAMSNTHHEITLLGPSDVSDAAAVALGRLVALLEELDELESSAGDASRFVDALAAALEAKHAFVATARGALVAPQR